MIILIIFIIFIFFYIKHNEKKKERIQKEYEEKQQQLEKQRQKQEQYIQERKNEFLSTLLSITFYKPKIYKEKNKRKYLKDFQTIVYQNIRKSTKEFDLENFIVLDIETTGLKPATDEIIEISMIKFIDANPTECLTTLIKPKKEIPYEATKINNITNDMVKDSPSISYIINDFNEFIRGYNIVGYNLEFDLKFLHCNGIDLFTEKRKFYDCLLLTRKYFKYVTDSFKLDNITQICNIYRPNNHRATEDALATGIIFRDIGKKYLKELEN